MGGQDKDGELASDEEGANTVAPCPEVMALERPVKPLRMPRVGMMITRSLPSRSLESSEDDWSGQLPDAGESSDQTTPFEPMVLS